MALWLCEGCGTLYAVGLYRCPRCHGTAGHEFGSKPEDQEHEGHPMAKITQHGGVTDATLEPEPEPVKAKPPAKKAAEARPPADTEVADKAPPPAKAAPAKKAAPTTTKSSK
jgi:hypothetical protein